MNDQLDIEELAVIKEAYRRLLGWLAGGVITVVVVSFAGGVWATSVRHDISRATEAIEKVAEEMSKMPTMSQINLQWEAFGAMNEELKMPPSLKEN